jgi:hypothetical protein
MIQTAPGHAIVDDIFARTDMERVLARLSSAAFERTRAGARHMRAVPVVGDLARDPRMVAMASEFVGPGAIPFRATLFDKSPGANWSVVWHQDTALPLRERFQDATWGPWSSKAGVLYAQRLPGHSNKWSLCGSVSTIP